MACRRPGSAACWSCGRCRCDRRSRRSDDRGGGRAAGAGRGGRFRHAAGAGDVSAATLAVVDGAGRCRWPAPATSRSPAGGACPLAAGGGAGGLPGGRTPWCVCSSACRHRRSSSRSICDACRASARIRRTPGIETETQDGKSQSLRGLNPDGAPADVERIDVAGLRRRRCHHQCGQREKFLHEILLESRGAPGKTTHPDGPQKCDADHALSMRRGRPRPGSINPYRHRDFGGFQVRCGIEVIRTIGGRSRRSSRLRRLMRSQLIDERLSAMSRCSR